MDHWNPDAYASKAGFVARLGGGVLDLLDPHAGERVLDLGCGDGALTQKLVDRGCSVVAVDSSAEMVAAAKARGLDARVVDGQALDFHAEFDAVFSSAALHWMPEPERVIAGVWQALKPGGRFIAEMGGAGNVASIVHALEAALVKRGLPARNPWYFPTVETCHALLARRGFAVDEIFAFERPTPLPGDVGGWLEVFGDAWLHVAPRAERAAIIAELVATLRAQLCNADGTWVADYVRLRFAAHKPA